MALGNIQNFKVQSAIKTMACWQGCASVMHAISKVTGGNIASFHALLTEYLSAVLVG